ncbi:hypothetical protein [Thiocystis violascens]|uniref:Nucleotidyltransferase n=1 Tax=Thiocystis violascens (strain ATCC 17096 / DSM 198 / 6111) TaxID=765911 RepID=I3YCP5_THIV6|nr:hypothetical protein [Thiocystis violascens]AFL74763.1 hypothetical protein Thivi_2851 [Thiocystis violascens DSM 198]
MSARTRTSSLKERLAYEAARIMVEQGLSDYDRAKRKAAERMGTPNRRQWPSNEAVQEAVLTHRRLFLGHVHERDCLDLRENALEAMKTFQGFRPRLIGPALSGAGDRQTGVELLLFSERPEDVLFALMEHGIPWQDAERDFRYPDGQRQSHPLFRFMAGEMPVKLIVLPMRALRNPPLDPVTEQPLRGADPEEVRRLLADANPA